MTKTSALSLAFSVFALSAVAQKRTDSSKTATPRIKTDWSKVKLGDRANDHFMIQFGHDGWAGGPDSTAPGGLSRHFNAYVMYDIPFKTDPRLSVAIGVGVGTSSVFFEKTSIDISRGNRAVIQNARGDYFKKHKISTAYAEVPIELRFVADPLKSGKSFKVAVGVKLGTMIDAHTKGKNLMNQAGNSVSGPKYVMKEKDRKFFNNVRLAPTLRVGYGAFSIYGAYQVTNFFKEGLGPNVRPYSIGICLGGL
ncbi:MAG: hypothetical protein EAY75_12965 [Bacteroidetes bacterium]|nr:MAG: hypothetical protein EAY75_12965 [Bacteroidota bacterium]